MLKPLSWIELNTDVIARNLKGLRDLLTNQAKLMAVVKGEAYGHGMVPVARAALQAGVDWLGVFHLEEALELESQGIRAPVLILGYVPLADLPEAIRHEYHLTISNIPTLQEAATAAKALGKKARLHLKLETGTHRLGFEEANLIQALQLIRTEDSLVLEGAYTHFANIEDTTEHDYAKEQLRKFDELLSMIRRQGFSVPLPHTACTAAAILFPATHFAMVRVGIGMYGIWPSKETLVSAQLEDRQSVSLTPAMTWKTMVAQLKDVSPGSYVGYGCSYRTTRPTMLAVLPVGYANGYDRRLSNCGHVLIQGLRAPVRGRVCMNLTMVDVTDITGVKLEEEVVLLGRQGQECITAEQMASWAQTINYEIVTRVDPHAPRIVLQSTWTETCSINVEQIAPLASGSEELPT